MAAIPQTRTVANPMVVAAGHRHVLVPKSGRTFPAFLVWLPPIDEANYPSNGPNGLSDKIKDRIGAFRWRSKLDFLLLARAASASAVRRSGVNGESSKVCQKPLHFPKSAYSKLSDAAGDSGGWLRPLVDDNHPEMTTISRMVPPEVAAGNVQSSGAVGEAGGTLNRYNPRMKKSIFQLDAFLRGIHRAYGDSHQRVDEAGGVAIDGCIDSSRGDGDEAVVAAAWKKFCRNEDVADLVSPQEGSPNQSRGSEALISCQRSRERQGFKRPLSDCCEPPERNAARLGQYFASEENAKKVVDAAIKKVEKYLLASRDRSSSDVQLLDWQRVCFVEPSCGDGRILECLRNTLLSSGKVPHGILAYDIDPSAVAACKDRMEKIKSPQKVSVRIRHQDFLALSKEDLLTDTNSCANSSALAQGVNALLPSIPSVHYVFVGGPPYSNGPGNGSAIKRDLPFLFTQHCMLLGAEVVSFLLPIRCASDETISCTSWNRQQCAQKEAGDESSGGEGSVWRCNNEKLDDSTFDFRGKEVTQPSILSCWFREETTRMAE